MVADRKDSDSNQFSTWLGQRFEERADRIEKRLEFLTKEVAREVLELRTENQELRHESGKRISTIELETQAGFADVKLKMAVMHYKIAIIFGAATSILVIIGNALMRKLGW